MADRLATEKGAESMLTVSNNLAVAGALAPFTYLINLNSLPVFDQWILRAAPFVIILAAVYLRLLALRTFRSLPER